MKVYDKERNELKHGDLVLYNGTDELHIVTIYGNNLNNIGLMNYPFSTSKGTIFLAENFEIRCSDDELVFLEFKKYKGE